MNNAIAVAPQFTRTHRLPPVRAFAHNPALIRAIARMHAYVYKSQRRADTYVYLAERDGFSRLPEPLRTELGPLRFVLDVALTPDRRLAREDPAEVRANLAARGFHLQFPPSAAGDPLEQDWGTDA